jgi:hypothetical protein
MEILSRLQSHLLPDPIAMILDIPLLTELEQREETRFLQPGAPYGSQDVWADGRQTGAEMALRQRRTSSSANKLRHYPIFLPHPQFSGMLYVVVLCVLWLAG